MKKILYTFAAFLSIGINAQTFDYPLNSAKTLLSGRNIVVGANTMVPVAISTYQTSQIGSPEKVAVSWYDASYNYGSQTKVRIYNTLTDFESNASGTDYTGFIGVEALAYDHSIAGNLFIMETENAGGKLRVFDTFMNEIASYTAGDIGNVLGSGFNNARGIDFDDQNNVYIADDANNRIIKIENPTNAANAIITDFLTLPNGSSPKSVAIANGTIYIACFGTQKVMIYDVASQTFVDEISTGTFSPLDISINKTNGAHVYVSMLDLVASIGKVVAYDLNGTSTQTYSDFGYTNGPWGLNCNSNGSIYCADGSNGRFVKYARTLLTGNDFESFTVDNQIGNSSIDNASKTVNITVPAAYDMTMVNTHYTTSFRSSATPLPWEYNLMPTDFSGGNTVQYTITAENGTQAIWNVFLNEELSIDEKTSAQLHLSPNPVNSILTIDNSTISIDKIEIINSLGEIEISCTSCESIDCSSLKQGVYFAVLNGETPIKFVKL